MRKVKVLVTHLCLTPCKPMDYSLPGSPHGINSPGKNAGVGSHSPGDLPNPGIKPRSAALQADFLWSEPPGKPYFCEIYLKLTLMGQCNEQLLHGIHGTTSPAALLSTGNSLFPLFFSVLSTW